MIGGTERILVCCGGKCADNDAGEIACAIEEELAKRTDHDSPSIEVIRVGCIGECDQGPIVRLMPRDITYYRVNAKHAAAIVDSLFGEPVKKLLYKKKRQHFEKLSDNPFFGLQHRVALRYVGAIDPLHIEDYIACGGYGMLANTQVTPNSDILEMLQEYGPHIKCKAFTSPEPTWLETRRQMPRRVVCNVNANGFDDSVGIALAEGSPHVIIEGMALAMRATGANEGIFHMRQADAPAYDILRRAIEDASTHGFLESTLGTIECGIAPSKLDDNALSSTTLFLDAETLATIPALLSRCLEHEDPAEDDEPEETKAFALGGKAKHIGLVEAPMGTALRALIIRIGGGVAGDRPLKAVQIGKPAGTFLPEHLIDLPIDFYSFAQNHISMDAGSLNVLDDRSCIVKTIRDDFKRLGTLSQIGDSPIGEKLREAIVILERLCAGNGGPDDIELLKCIGLQMRDGATCSYGQRAAHSLLSSIEHFRSEYELHALEKRCPAGSCPALTQFAISPEACAGCDVCSNACPVKAITGEQRQPHAIDAEKCISCGTCRDLCRFHAVLTRRRSPVSEANNPLQER